MQPKPAQNSSARSSTAIKRLSKIRRETVIFTLVAFGLGSAQALLCYFGTTQNIQLLQHSSGLLLYFAAILLPRWFGWLTTLVFLLSSLAVADFRIAPSPIEAAVAVETVRVATFALVLAYSSRFRLPPPPILVIGVLWVALLGFLWLQPAVRIYGFPAESAQLAPQIAIEFTAAILFGLLRLSPLFNSLLTGTRQAYSARVVLIELNTLTAFLCSGAIGLMLLAATKTSLSNITPHLGHYRLEISLAFLMLLGIPALVGLFLTRTLSGFFKHLRTAATPSSKLLTDPASTLPVIEFQEASRQTRALAVKADTDNRERTQQIKSLKIELEGVKEELQQSKSRASSLSRLVDAAPWGCIGLSSAGRVLYHNERFVRLLEVTNDALPNKHFSDLRGTHRWYGEVATLLSLAVNGYAQLERGEVLEQISSSVEGYYLEIVFAVLSPATQAELSQEHGRVQLPIETAFALFLRKLPDLREYQLRLISPNSLEFLGGKALELCHQVRGELQTVVQHLSAANSAQTSSGAFRVDDSSQNERALETMLLLKNIERNLKKSSDSLDYLLADAGPLETEREEINVTKLLQDSLSFLTELLNIDGQLELRNVPERISGNRPQEIIAEPQLKEPKDCLVTACPGELTRFSAYLLALIRSLAPKTPEIEITVGYENIGAGTASIIPGSYPGRFCRIVISHPGQSINAHLVGGKLNSLHDLAGESNSTEVSLTFLTLQTKRLGGFISLQSAATKGTQLTFYIPVDRQRRYTANNDDSMLSNTTIVEPSSAPLSRHALVIGRNEDTFAALESMLRELGYAAKIEQPEELTESLDSRYDFGGIGFENSAEKSKASDLGALAESAFDLLILMVDQVTKQSLELLEQLRSLNPEARTLIVTEPDQAKERFPSGVRKLIRPFDLPSLRSAIEKL